MKLTKEQKDKLARRFRAELGKAEKDSCIHEYNFFFAPEKLVCFNVAVGPVDSKEIGILRNIFDLMKAAENVLWVDGESPGGIEAHEMLVEVLDKMTDLKKPF